VGLYTELFYAIIPTLFYAFCWSGIPTSLHSCSKSKRFHIKNYYVAAHIKITV